MPSSPRSALAELISSAIASRGSGAQSDLARVLDVTPTTVRRWRLGETIPEPSYWQDLETYFAWAAGTIDGVLAEDSATRLAKARQKARASLADPKATDAARATAVALEALAIAEALQERVSHLEELAGVTRSKQFATAADTGREDARVVEDLGTSRRRVQSVPESE